MARFKGVNKALQASGRAQEPKETHPILVDDVPVSTADISHGWAQLGAERGFDPPPLAESTFCFKARRKTGLTTLNAGRVGALTLDFDLASRFVVASQVTRIKVPGVNTLDNIMAKLESDIRSGQRRFTHVIFDPLDGLIDILADVYRKANENQEYYDTDYGRGHARMRDMVATKLDGLRRLGYGWSVNCHLDWAEAGMGDKKVAYLRDSIVPTTTQWISSKADYLLQYNVEERHELVKEGNKSVSKLAREWVLTSEQVLGRGADPDLGIRLPLPKRMVIPKINGWSVVEQGYSGAVAQARLENSRAG